MDSFHVEPAELRECAQYLRTLTNAFDSISRFTRAEGCSVAGFAGLLAALIPAVNLVGEVFDAAMGLGRDRLDGSAEGLATSAEYYQSTDEANAARSDATIVPDAPQRVRG